MKRTQVAATVPSRPSLDDEPGFAEIVQSQLQWFDHLASLQTTWLMSCVGLQAAFWQQWASAPLMIAPWMVWHSGTEQA